MIPQMVASMTLLTISHIRRRHTHLWKCKGQLKCMSWRSRLLSIGLQTLGSILMITKIKMSKNIILIWQSALCMKLTKVQLHQSYLPTTTKTSFRTQAQAVVLVSIFKKLNKVLKNHLWRASLSCAMNCLTWALILKPRDFLWLKCKKSNRQMNLKNPKLNKLKAWPKLKRYSL